MMTELRTHLMSDNTLQSLVDSRVHPIMLPQHSTFPAISYQLISTLPHSTLDAAINLDRYRIQFDVWASKYLDMEAVSLALRAAIDGYQGQMGGSPGLLVQGAFAVLERDSYEPEPELYRRSLDFYFWVKF